MSPKQYENWLDFSTRMARESARYWTERRRRLLVRTVRDIIECTWHEYGEDITDWDSAPAWLCDTIEERVENRGFIHWIDDDKRGCFRRETRFGTMIMCCIRAGFDVAVTPSAGVIGGRFTVGMIRRMYPNGLPAFVDAFMAPTEANQLPFAALTNDVMVWL